RRACPPGRSRWARRWWGSSPRGGRRNRSRPTPPRRTSSSRSSSAWSPPAPREGVAVDRLVPDDVDLARVSDRLRVLVRDPGEHRDFLLGEAELLHRRDADFIGEPVDLLDPDPRSLEGRDAVHVDVETLRDARVTLWRRRRVVLADGPAHARRQRRARGLVPTASGLASRLWRARARAP